MQLKIEVVCELCGENIMVMNQRGLGKISLDTPLVEFTEILTHDCSMIKRRIASKLIYSLASIIPMSISVSGYESSTPAGK